MNAQQFTAKSLLEFLAEKIGCVYLSDLCYLSDQQRTFLLQAIKEIPAELVSLSEWNDALDYLTHRSAAKSVEVAKETLLNRLSPNASCSDTNQLPRN